MRALQWALRLAPDSRQAQARLQICEAHILRISIRPSRAPATQATYRRAIDRFRAASRLDPDSFDPYLGIGRIAVYGLVRLVFEWLGMTAAGGFTMSIVKRVRSLAVAAIGLLLLSDALHVGHHRSLPNRGRPGASS